MKLFFRLSEIAWLFFKLGTIGFGGPPANIALMEQETVHKRKWVNQDYFLDMLAATNLVPGPNAAEMATHLGYVYAGFPGLFTAGFTYILPSFLISLALSVIYVEYGNLPEIEAIFYGINPIIISIILISSYRLGKGVITDKRKIIIGIGSLVAAFLGIDEILLILLAGLAGVLAYQYPYSLICLSPFSPIQLQFFNILLTSQIKLDKLFLFFLRTGALLFGSGLALFAFIQSDIVTKYGWLTQHELLDAITVGQITPGPVSSAATFIGYLIAGLPGAIAASIGIFLPSFLIVLIVGKWLPQLRKSIIIQRFLKGVTIGVIALIFIVALRISQTAIVDILTFSISLVSLFLLFRFEIETIWLILVGGIIGLIKLILIN
ncbi:MAG TPA: chromate efflux transporter [Anaerolineae bacterium]|nr:chromate efflux transporter [Anaerolineae bacterium]